MLTEISKYEETRITRDYLRSEQNRLVENDPFRRKGKLARKGKMSRVEAREARAEMSDW